MERISVRANLFPDALRCASAASCSSVAPKRFYGFSGCAYLVFRLINSEKFPSFNMTATIRGRKCRTFDENGFVTATATAEDVGDGDGDAVRFKLAFDDIENVSAVTVDGDPFTEISATNQTGDVFHVNKLKGYIEFLTAPANGLEILVTYTYFVREWTQNPAMHVVYLLTEKVRGKGLDASKVDWQSAVDLRDYCDEEIIWRNANGSNVEPRFQCNYAIDFRQTIQDHVRAILDSCYAALFLSNGKFVMKARRDGSSVFSFNDSNILKDSFESTMIERSERSNRVHVFIHPSETYNAETEVTRDDLVDQAARATNVGNDGIVEETLRTPAVAEVSQAERFAETVLRESVKMRWLVSLKTTVKGLALEPLDIVDVTHSSQPGWNAKEFRIEDISYDQDDRMILKLSEYFAGAYF